jgi:hypothetical protein
MSEKLDGNTVQRITKAAAAIEIEALRAAGTYPKFNSGHEGWAVIKEELDELWREVRKYPNAVPDELRHEAIHVGAMAVRFIADLCEDQAHE